MSQALRQKIVSYLASHRYLTMATVSTEGRPVVHTIGYVSREAVVYLATNRNTRKYKNLLQNERVAYAVTAEDEEEGGVAGVQVEGRGEVIRDQKEQDSILKLLMKKFPFVSNLSQQNIVFIKIVPFTADYFCYKEESIYKERESFINGEPVHQ